MAIKTANKNSTAPAKVVSTYVGDEGQLLTSNQEIGEGYMSMSDAIPDGMTWQQAWAIIKSIPGDGKDDNVQQARVEALERATPVTHGTVDPMPVRKDAQGNPTAPLSAIPKHRQVAVRFGAMVDDTFVAHLDKAAEAKEDLDGAPLLICADLERLYSNVDGENVLLSWPIPGSGTKKWMEAHPQWNQQTDHYEAPVGDGTKVKGTFYGDFFDATPKGRSYAAILMHLDNFIKNDCVPIATTPDNDLFNRLKSKKRETEAERARWASRRGNSINRLRRAVKFQQQKAALKELPKIGLAFANPDIEIAAKMPKPILLYSTIQRPGEAPTVAPAISLSAFNNLKMDQAAASEAQDLPTLMATSKRKPRTADAASDALASKEGTDTAVFNVKQLETALSAAISYLDTDDGPMAVYSLLSKQTEDRNRMLSNLFEMRFHVNAICKKFEPQYQAMLEAQNAADAAAKQAEIDAKKTKAA